MEASLRIGQFKPTRRGEHFKDEWTDGYAMEEINRRLQKINQERNEIVNATQNLRKRKVTTKEQKKFVLFFFKLDNFTVLGKSVISLAIIFLLLQLLYH